MAELEAIKKLLESIPKEWSEIIIGGATNWPTLYMALVKVYQSKNNISPTWDNIFKFANLVNFANIKCIVLGQDPYPNVTDATGLAFSSYSSLPVSARVIFTRMHEEKILEKMPTHANLNSWASQGVLLINTALTCLIGQSKSHSEFWHTWMDGFISRLNAKFNVPWILCGGDAKKYSPLITNGKILTTPHPSAEAYGGKYKFEANVFASVPEINWNSVNECSKIINIWTDGSCIPNNSSPESRGGWAYVFEDGFQEYGALSLAIVPTNYRTEGAAIFYAMREACVYITKKSHSNVKEEDRDYTILHETQKNITEQGLPYVRIFSDSRTWINNITKDIPRWIAKNEVDKHIAPDIVRLLWEMYTKLNQFAVVEFVHVYSHTGVKFNDIADQLADHGRSLPPGTSQKITNLN